MIEEEKIIRKLILGTDAYKLTHIFQYPKDTEVIFSNIVMRSVDQDSIFKDQQNFVPGPIKYPLDKLNEKFEVFFNLDRAILSQILLKIDLELDEFIGEKHLNTENWLRLYDYKKIPLDIYYLPENVEIAINTPLLVLYNIDRNFYWLVNFLETNLLAEVWRLSTSTNIAKKLYDLAKKFADETGSDFNPYQFHDFSYRGMGSYDSAILSALGHLSYFNGTDTVPAVYEYKKYINSTKKITSIPATEHSTMIINGREKEEETFSNLLKIYPRGMISIVSDSYDYFNFLINILSKFKEDILTRKGKIIIRPDSGKYQEIILKSLDILGEIFGYSLNKKSYKILNPQIGLIFGDGLTYQKIVMILEMMKKNNWASENIIFGLGGSIYQNNSRDTLGFVFKTSFVKVGGIEKAVYKSPKTNAAKTSLKGIVFVNNNNQVVQEAKFVDLYNQNKNIMIKYKFRI